MNQSDRKLINGQQKNIVSEWIGEFSRLTAGKADNDMTYQSLKSREDEFVEIIEKNDKQLDSLWKNGIFSESL